MNLSTHFSLEELVATQHREIDNTPPAAIVETLRRTAQGLETVRTQLGVPLIISSGYRSPELNRAVGGQPSSQHQTGEAADFIAPAFGAPNTIVAALMDCTAVEYDQLILEELGGRAWVHVSFSARPRRQALIIDRTGVRPMRG